VKASRLTLALLIGALGATLPADPPIARDVKQLQIVDDFSVKAEVLAREWYSKIETILSTKGPESPGIKIVFDASYTGVAATSGSQIRVSIAYVTKHPEDLGMIVHELTHAIQGYPKYDPVWLVEGIADYVRWFNYEPVEKRPHPTADKAKARASYRTTAAFLDWAVRTYDKMLVKKLNGTLRDGSYTDETWKTLTGKTLDELEVEWIASLKSGG
jgi:hypothetical protein